MSHTKTAQHTPGPWRAEFGERAHGTSGALVRDRIGIVAEAYPRNPSGTEQTANARLIAAAPDLLAALNAILNDVDQDKADGIETPDWAPAAYAAYAKATTGST